MDRDVSDVDQGVVTEKAEAAMTLAKKHYEVEVGLKHVIHFSGSPQTEISRSEPIKLLEVNTNTIASGVMPIYFGPAPASGIPFPSVIVEVTPEEYEKIQRSELSLPKGWENPQELKPPFSSGG